MKRARVTPAQLAEGLRRLSVQAPEAIKDTMVEAGMRLQGSLLQREIASTDPQPVDQGQYKAGWILTEIEDGAVVGNTTSQALWVERGRGPGPVPYKAILEWVKRKGFVRASVKAEKRGQGRDSKGRFKGASKSDIEQAEASAALAIQRKIQWRGVEPRWPLWRALTALGDKVPGMLRRALGRLR